MKQKKKYLRTRTIECPACRDKTPSSHLFQLEHKKETFKEIWIKKAMREQDLNKEAAITLFYRIKPQQAYNSHTVVKEQQEYPDIEEQVLPRYSFFRYIHHLYDYAYMKGIPCQKCGHLIEEK